MRLVYTTQITLPLQTMEDLQQYCFLNGRDKDVIVNEAIATFLDALKAQRMPDKDN